jgi:tetratricopeptide (TPR) repeat protein
LGQNQAAIFDYNRAIDINPNLAILYLNRGFAKYKLGNKREAISDFDRAISLKSNFTQAYVNRGILKSQSGDKVGAISDLIKAAELFRQQGNVTDYQEAIKLVKKMREK